MIDVALLASRAHALDIALHTIDVRVGDDRMLSAHADPRGHHTPQRMYSVSKTVTSLAVGLLAAEGALDLDDSVVHHFPDLAAGAPVHPWLEATTLRHMLAMTGPHRSTTYKIHEGGWLESYFRVPPTHPPGTLFTYDTSASYTLAALVERVTGGTLADYLRPRVLDPIGVSAGFRFLAGPDGFSHGGSGLISTPDDLSRLAHLLNAGGMHDGAQLLPVEYVDAATSPQSDTATVRWGAPFRAGYGYQLWLPPVGGWLMFGMAGQIVYGEPESGVSVVVTADSQAAVAGDQKLLDLALDHVVEPARELARSSSVRSVPTHDALGWPAPRHDDAHARRWSGTWTTLTPDAGPTKLTLDVAAGGGTLASSDGWSITFDTSGPHSATVTDEPTVVTAGWSAPAVLDVRCAMHGDELATVRMRLAIAADGTLAVQSQGFGETLDPRWTFHAAFTPAD